MKAFNLLKITNIHLIFLIFQIGSNTIIEHIFHINEFRLYLESQTFLIHLIKIEF
jgi:hypothetical protein